MLGELVHPVSGIARGEERDKARLHKVALQKLTEGGASFEESSVKKGLKELEAGAAMRVLLRAE